MKKNNKIIIVLIILLLVLLLSGIVVYNVFHKEEDTFFQYDQKYTIENCKTDDCKMPREIKYDLLELKTEIPELDSAIETINQKTIDYYNQTKNSNLNSEVCVQVKDLYNYRFITLSFFSNYETDKYMTIAVSRQHKDMCTGEKTTDPTEVYIYDKNRKKIITDDEFRTQEKITEEIILKSIQHYNEDNGKNCIIKNDSKLYYSVDGELIISAYDDTSKSYYDVEIVK